MTVACLTACSSSRQQLPNQELTTQQRDAGTPVDAAGTVAIPLMPEELAAKIGAARVVVAIDQVHPDPFPMGGLIPAALPCSRALVRSAEIIVLLVSEDNQVSLFATGVNEDEVRSCVPEWNQVLGMRTRDVDGTLMLTIFQHEFAVTSQRSMLSVAEIGSTLPDRPPTSDQRALLARLPPDTRTWVFARGFPPVSVGVDTMGAWFTKTKSSVRVTIVSGGDDAAALEREIAGMASGMKNAALEKGMTFGDDWITTSTAPGTATVVLTLPRELLDDPQAGAD